MRKYITLFLISFLLFSCNGNSQVNKSNPINGYYQAELLDKSDSHTGFYHC